MNAKDSAINESPNAKIDDLIGSDNSLVIDWRSEELEVLDGLKHFVVGFDFTLRYTESHCEICMTFCGRQHHDSLELRPQNCFRVVLAASGLINPEYEIRVYTPTVSSDTHTFLIRSQEFWREFDQHPDAKRRRVFSSIDFLDRAWGLSCTTKSQWRADWLLTVVMAIPEAIVSVATRVHLAWNRFCIPRCPDCRAKLRTRKAQQCVECGARWKN